MMRRAEEYPFESCVEANVTSTKSTAFGVSACVLLAGSIVFGRQQDRDLSGIHGIPVEGHDIVAGIEIVGTKQLDLSRSGWDKLDKRLREVTPLLAYGSFNGQAGFLGGYGRLPANTCTFWPVASTTQPHRASAPGLPTVLVISTTDDPATPYQDGVDLAEQLGGALLTFEGSQHTASFYGDACVDDIATKYLVDLIVPPKDARC